MTPISNMVKTHVIKKNLPTNENNGIDKKAMPKRQGTYDFKYLSEKILDRNFIIIEITAFSFAFLCSR